MYCPQMTQTPASKAVPAGAPRMPARYFGLLCDRLAEQGVDVSAMLGDAGLTRPQIYGANAGLSVAQYEALLDAAGRASGRRDLGFLLGRQIKLSSHEILGYGILTSPTLDYAISLTARYYRLMTPWLRLLYRRGPVSAELEFQPTMRMSSQAMHALLEIVIVSAHEQIKSLLQDRLGPYDIHVSYPEPPHAQQYRTLLQPARFHFEAQALPGGRLVFDAGLMALPLPMADRATLQMAEARCEALMQQTAEAAGVGEWIAMMLRESQMGFPTLDELARLLNLSPRTLDRHLGREGTRFLDLSKRIRHERACELLATGMQATQVAYQLGYSDPGNFSRAFRRDSGMSPRAYAALHRAKP